jgi:hypothetical protein
MDRPSKALKSALRLVSLLKLRSRNLQQITRCRLARAAAAHGFHESASARRMVVNRSWHAGCLSVVAEPGQRKPNSIQTATVCMASQHWGCAPEL